MTTAKSRLIEVCLEYNKFEGMYRNVLEIVAMEMKIFMEMVDTHSGKIKPDEILQMKRVTKLLWIFDRKSGHKIVMHQRRIKKALKEWLKEVANTNEILQAFNP